MAGVATSPRGGHGGSTPRPSESASTRAASAHDHETACENLVNAEAAKFEEERTPSSAELERTSEGVRGMCVVSIVVCLEATRRRSRRGGVGAAAADGAARPRDAVRRAGGDLVYNAEVLWTPSSADEALFKDEMLVDFPELLAL